MDPSPQGGRARAPERPDSRSVSRVHGSPVVTPDTDPGLELAGPGGGPAVPTGVLYYLFLNDDLHWSVGVCTESAQGLVGVGQGQNPESRAGVRGRCRQVPTLPRTYRNDLCVCAPGRDQSAPE